MSYWQIDPNEVRNVLQTVHDTAQGYAEDMSVTALEECVADVSWGGPVTAAVPEALVAAIVRQTAEFEAISRSLTAALNGVNDATTAYENGQEGMVATIHLQMAVEAFSEPEPAEQHNLWRVV